MHPFPLIEALWASLDQTHPSGDDPARVLEALNRFYGDFHRTFRESRTKRWRTELFETLEPKLRRDLNALLKLCNSLQQHKKPPYPQEDLKELKRLDQLTRTHLYQLELEEQSFQLPASPSPRLFELNYFYQGWARNFLTPKPLQAFLANYNRELQASAEQLQNVKKSGQNLGPESKELQLADQTMAEFESLREQMNQLRTNISSGPEACRTIVDRILNTGKDLARSFQELEACSPPQTPCPFCQGSLSLTGRCKQCGRLLPHLEESIAASSENPSSFRSHNLRTLDLALLAWEQSQKTATDWNDCQSSLREFCRSVDSGNKRVEMLPTSSERPIDPDSPQRQSELKLQEVATVFTRARNKMATFAAQSYPPNEPLEVDWRDELIDIEDTLESLQTSLQPQT